MQAGAKAKNIHVTSKTHHKRPKPTSTINSPDLPLLKIRRLSRVLLLAKGDKDVTSAYCSKRRIRMRACHAHVQIQLLLFFYLSPVILSLEGFLKGICDSRFRPFNSSPCYETILYGELLVPSPVTLVVDLREIEGRTP